jgi:hypothetical protein
MSNNYDFSKNSFYGKKCYSKIHLESDTDLEKRFKSLIAFWGSTGYLAWNYLIDNNTKEISLLKLNESLLKMGKFYSNDKPKIDFKTKDYENYEFKRRLCSEIYPNLSENEFTKTLSQFFKINQTKDIVVLKLMTVSKTSKLGIDSFSKIEKDRWMSFTILPNAEFNDVINDPFEYLLPSSIGNNENFEFIIIQLPLNFKYVATDNLCDINEIIINSNELFLFKNELKIEFVKEDASKIYVIPT